MFPGTGIDGIDLGTGWAKRQWGDDGAGPHILKKIQRAIRTHTETLLQKFGKERVLFGLVGRSKNPDVEGTWHGAPSPTLAHVFGAHAKNWEGKDGTPIRGKGQAAGMVHHGPSVFGIITTPVAGDPKPVAGGSSSADSEDVSEDTCPDTPNEICITAKTISGKKLKYFYRVIGIDQGISVPTGALLRAGKGHGRHLTP